MITSPQEYNKFLTIVEDPNEFAQLFRMPTDEPIYQIDLNSRIVEAPEFLSIKKDHNAETLWFKTDRFFENIDLFGGTCWIQFITAKGKKFFYHTKPMIADLGGPHDEILIPWVVSRDLAEDEGVVQFSFQFFKLKEDRTEFSYVINTQVAKSKVLPGLWVDPLNDTENNYKPDNEEDPLASELHRLTEAYERLAGDYNLFWVEV